MVGNSWPGHRKDCPHSWRWLCLPPTVVHEYRHHFAMQRVSSAIIPIKPSGHIRFWLGGYCGRPRKLMRIEPQLSSMPVPDDTRTPPEDRAMRIASVSHVVFAAIMIAIGIVGLIKGDLTSVWDPIPQDSHALAYLCSFIFLANGIGLLWRRTAA